MGVSGDGVMGGAWVGEDVAKADGAVVVEVPLGGEEVVFFFVHFRERWREGGRIEGERDKEMKKGKNEV